VTAQGVALAREKGWVLTWDETSWLYLLNRAGERQAQMRLAGGLAAAGCADDGSAYAAVGKRGEVCWLAPDLMARWERSLPHPALAVALDSFGQYLAASDIRGTLQIFNRLGRPVCQLQSPRPLHYLTFVPGAPFLLASADYGLVACFDLTGRWVWRDGLVAHVGALTVSGDGSQILLACFSEGLQRYTLSGSKQGRLAVRETCRLASLTFDGNKILLTGMGKELSLLNREGRTLATHTLQAPAHSLAMAALGDSAVAAQADGSVIGLGLRDRA
jgi:hypothetical protein